MEILISILLITFIIIVCLHTTGILNKHKDTFNKENKMDPDYSNEFNPNRDPLKQEAETALLTEEEEEEEEEEANEPTKEINSYSSGTSWESLPEAIDKRAQELLEEDDEWE